MKKYIVNVSYTTGTNMVLFTKARNYISLEQKMAVWLKDIKDLVVGYEYSEVRFKNRIDILCGTVIGIDAIKNCKYIKNWSE